MFTKASLVWYTKEIGISFQLRMKYIFISGGVISGIGKGIATASIPSSLKARA